MAYFKVPFINGVLDIDYSTMRNGIHLPGTNEAIVLLDDNVNVRSSWIAATQTDWDNATSPTLDQLKQSKMNQLLQSYATSFTTFQSSALGTVHTYPIDAEAQKNLDYYVKIAAANPNKGIFSFKTIENGIVDHTRAQFLQLVEDVESFEINLDKKFETKDKQRTSSTTNDEVNSIIWNDITAPATPTGLTGAPGTGSANLSWTANTEIDVQIGGGYNVYKAGVKVNTSPITATSYTVTGLTTGSAVSFTVSAVDSDGNESSQSALVTVTPN